MKALFCTDGSDNFSYVIEKTLPFLKPDTEISIMYVMDSGVLTTFVTFPIEEEEGFHKRKGIGQDILDKAANLIKSKGFNFVETNYFFGHPSEIILENINTNNFDIAVLGSHGKKGIKKWLGSTSRKVVERSSIPVFIAKSQKKQNNNLPEPKEVLITSDGSDYSLNAISTSLDILNLENSSIEILTVNPGKESLPLEIITDKQWLNNYLKKQQEITTDILKKSENILINNKIIPKNSFSLEGDPAEEILNYTNNNFKDLIIMGSHGKTGLSDLLLGSVSKRVLDNTMTSVLIVPTRKKIH